jgi:hypothetical protein
VGDLAEEVRDPEPVTRGDLERFHVKQQTVLEWLHCWAITQATEAGSEEEAAVVLDSYAKDILLPVLSNYVGVLRRASHGKALMEEIWRRPDLSPDR